MFGRITWRPPKQSVTHSGAKRHTKKRAETIERVFADAKEKHGLRYTTLRGKAKGYNAGFAYFRLHEFKKAGDMEIKRPEVPVKVRLFICFSRFSKRLAVWRAKIHPLRG